MLQREFAAPGGLAGTSAGLPGWLRLEKFSRTVGMGRAEE
jgi:hypothetical protein